jgi:hypothetical protein
MAGKWYGVKTLYRMEATGRPHGTDELYDAAATLFEERIVLFRAASFEEAIEKGQRDAEHYASGYDHQNAYGQQVRCRYLGEYDAFEMSEEPGEGVEAYSRTALVDKSIKDKTLGDWALGTEKGIDSRRKKFLPPED